MNNKPVFPMKTLKIILMLLPFLGLFSSCEKDEIKKDDPEKEPEPLLTKDELTEKLKPDFHLIGSENIDVQDTLQIEISCDHPDTITDNGIKRFFRYKVDSIHLLAKSNQEYEKSFKAPENLNLNDTLSIELDKELRYKDTYDLYLKIIYQEKRDGKWEDFFEEKDYAGYSTFKTKVQTNKLSDPPLVLNNDSIYFFERIRFENKIHAIVSFHFTPGKEFTFSRHGHEVFKGRMVVDDAYLQENGTRKEIDVEKDEDQYRLSYNKPFNPDNDYSFVVKTSLQEKVDGEWVQLSFEDKTEKYSVEKEIPVDVENISNDGLVPEVYVESYPMPRQFNFYPQEYPRGFIRFTHSFNSFPQLSESENFSLKFYKYPEKELIYTTEGEYDAETGRIWYDFPENLEKETPYGIELFQDGTLVYKTSFRVSQYNHFAEKIPENLNVRFYYDVNDSIDILGCTEYFEENDEEGLAYYETQKITLRISLLLDEWDWYRNSIFHYIYENHPVVPSLQFSRNISENGIHPAETVDLWQIYYGRKVSKQEMESGQFDYEADFFHVMNTLIHTLATDYNEAFRAVRETYSSEAEIENSQLREIYNNPSSEVSKMYDYSKMGDYSVLFEYILPGTDIVTSKHVLEVENNPL